MYYDRHTSYKFHGDVNDMKCTMTITTFQKHMVSEYEANIRYGIDSPSLEEKCFNGWMWIAPKNSMDVAIWESSTEVKELEGQKAIDKFVWYQEMRKAGHIRDIEGNKI